MESDNCQSEAEGEAEGEAVSAESKQRRAERRASRPQPSEVLTSAESVRAVAVVRDPRGGYACVVLTLPVEAIEAYAVARSAPDHRGFAVERAKREIEGDA